MASWKRSSILSAPRIVRSVTATDAQARATVGQEVTRAAVALEAAGVPDARHEARAIWGALVGLPAGDSWLLDKQPAPPGQIDAFRVAVSRRCAGEPMAYAVESASFRMLELAVDARVLIPRPETEGLVDVVLKWVSAEQRSGAVADIGVGSGCIALSLALEGSFERVVGTDIVPGALEVAAANLQRVRPSTYVEFRLGEFYSPLAGEIFDALVSNPPYVTAEEFEGLEPGVRCYEPREALVSGKFGMEHIGRLLAEGKGYLSEGGLIALEVDSERASMALELAREAGWCNARLERDIFGRPRFLLATAG
jgi:release factor glutamine methyltransferase